MPHEDRKGEHGAPKSWDETHSFRELQSTGLLWLINRVVFHPRGFALGMVPEGNEPGAPYGGWVLLGDGSEPWTFADNDGGPTEDELFAKVQEVLAPRART
jgi:hypothetical protein